MSTKTNKVALLYDPIQLEVFKHRFASIAEEMGAVLRRSSYSPNIKERRDYSCALFDTQGRMIAQAAHIPVHLGSMPLSVEAAVMEFSGDLAPGDVIVLNDPYRGGTHLPDITMVSPVFMPGNSSKELVGFVGSRAHHADVGGMSPGSMPIATEIYQEGLIIPPVKLLSGGKMNQDIYKILLSNVRTPSERDGDLRAQIAANLRGSKRLVELVEAHNEETVQRYMQALLDYTERLTRKLLRQLPDGEYRFSDFLDNDGIGNSPVNIQVRIKVNQDSAVVDFSGSAVQQKGSVNAVYAITLSAVYYVFRCLIDLDAPNNAGCLVPLTVIAPPGSVVNAQPPAPVAGGNVETSQRIVDVLLGALAQALPERIPAASQGTMNNLTIGGQVGNTAFTYYETIAGGSGASLEQSGRSAVHSHMTNTLNTPIEALEFAYPLRALRYAIRRNSGGMGKSHGGNGITREIQVLVDANATLLTERRVYSPYGLHGGEPGRRGSNYLIRDGSNFDLPGKGNIELHAGDILGIETPGGGGFGDAGE